MKKINWSNIIEWAIIVVLIIGMIVGGLAYMRAITLVEGLITILVFISGSVMGAIFMKWYAKFVKKLPW